MLMRMAIAGLVALFVAAMAPVDASDQTSPSDFTWASRYDSMHRVTGTIAPDPDGATGALHYAAVRTTYDGGGHPTVVEKGELSSWQDENTLPSAWPAWSGSSGFRIFSKIITTYDTYDRKILETTWGSNDGGSTWVESGASQYSYDALGRLDCTAVRMNPATWGALPTSACTLATSGTYGPDRIVKNVYDAAGQVLKTIKAYGVSQLQQDYVTYTYTPNGKQKTVKDANGNLATYSYDGFDRLAAWAFSSKTVTGSSASCTLGTITETTETFAAPGGTVSVAVTGPSETRAATDDCEKYAYDRNGNRTKLMKRDGRVVRYTYDALNRMSVKAVPDNGCPTSPVNPDICTNPPASATRDVYYAYDLRGLQTAARFDGASGSDAVLSAYDGFGRLTSTTTAMGGVSRSVSHTYDADGNRLTTGWPDALKVTYAYDGLDRLNWAYEGTSTVLLQYGYTAA